MLLRRLRVHNYKSLRNIDFAPTPLTVLIGPNASGKSNFANALHFLSEVYQHGLEVAIARKGGFENIAFRKQRRTKAPIQFEVTLEGSGRRLIGGLTLGSDHRTSLKSVRFVHEFGVDTPSTGIKAEFSVRDERFTIFGSDEDLDEQKSLFPTAWRPLVRLSNEQRTLKVETLSNEPAAESVREFLSIYSQRLFRRQLEDQELLTNALPLRGVIRPFSEAISEFAVYQLSPVSLRLPGVPTPNPTLTLAGENLPALVDWLQQKHATEWKSVMSGMREVIPALSDVEVQYLHTKALGLFFSEDGVGRPWGVDEVSDGTIQSLAHFATAADPRTSLLMIEEPETSVHPWIIRALMRRFRAVSHSKNVVVTTHSPVLIDLLEPDEAWILSRRDGETSMDRLVDIEPDISKQFNAGEFKLSQFLDAGFVPRAVPGGVE